MWEQLIRARSPEARQSAAVAPAPDSGAPGAGVRPMGLRVATPRSHKSQRGTRRRPKNNGAEKGGGGEEPAPTRGAAPSPHASSGRAKNGLCLDVGVCARGKPPLAHLIESSLPRRRAGGRGRAACRAPTAPAARAAAASGLRNSTFIRTRRKPLDGNSNGMLGSSWAGGGGARARARVGWGQAGRGARPAGSHLPTAAGASLLT